MCVRENVLPVNGLYRKVDGKWLVNAVNFGTTTAVLESRHLVGYVNVCMDTPEEGVGEVGELSHKAEEELTEQEKREREDFIRESLKLEENDMLKNNTDMKKRMFELFWKNFDVMAVNSADFGKTDLVKCKIELVEGARPVRAKVRPLAPNLQEDLKRQLGEWRESKIIEPATSAWNSALVPVKKKGTDKFRWAIDFRALNEVTVADAYHIPNIEATLSRLAGAKVFSVLDSCGAFHAISMDPDSRDLTAFATPNSGSFRFCRLPFGVKNGPAIYSRLVDKMLSMIPGGNMFSLAYIDDVILYSKSLTEHYGHVAEVIRLHRRCGLKLNVKKCEFFQPRVQYLGFMVSHEGIEMVPKYVEKIQSWPLPGTIKDLKSFLGFCSYYRSFIKDFAKLTARMNEFRDGEKLVWDDGMRENFEKLKKEFLSAPCRGFPDFESDKPFILDTDWSMEAIAGVLSQEQGGSERFLACCCRKNNEAERKYSSHKGELLAVYWSLGKFQHILRAKKFVLRSDNSPVVYMRTGKNMNRGAMNRWLDYIESFSFDVLHRAGVANRNADALSRRSDLSEEEMSDGEEEDVAYELGEMNVVNDKVLNMSVVKVYVDAQKKDKDVSEVYNWVKEGKFPSKIEMKWKNSRLKQYYRVRQLLRINEVTKVLMIHARICLPTSLWGDIFKKYHEEGKHQGVDKTYARIRVGFYGPGLWQYVQLRVQNCVGCLAKWQTEKSDRKSNDPVYTEGTSSFGDILYIDLVGPLNPPNRFRGRMCGHILTMMDGFSRHLTAVPVPDMSAETTARVLVEDFILKYGAPSRIHSDNGKNFVAEVFKAVLEMFDISGTHTPTYNPQSNRVERVHNTIMRLMRSDSGVSEKRWVDKLQPAVFLYNSSVHRQTGLSPFEAVYGHPAQMPLKYIFPILAEETNKNFVERVISMQDKMKENEELMRRLGEDYAVRLRTNVGKNVNKIEKDDIVYYIIPVWTAAMSVKLGSRWQGPYRVVEKLSDSVLRIKPTGDWCEDKEKEFVTNISRVRKIDQRFLMTEQGTIFSKRVENYREAAVKYDIDPLMEDVVLKCADSERRVMPDRAVKCKGLKSGQVAVFQER